MALFLRNQEHLPSRPCFGRSAAQIRPVGSACQWSCCPTGCSHGMTTFAVITPRRLQTQLSVFHPLQEGGDTADRSCSSNAGASLVSSTSRTAPTRQAASTILSTCSTLTVTCSAYGSTLMDPNPAPSGRAARLGQDRPMKGSRFTRARHRRQFARDGNDCQTRHKHPFVCKDVLPAGEGDLAPGPQGTPQVREGCRRIREEHDAELGEDSSTYHAKICGLRVGGDELASVHTFTVRSGTCDRQHRGCNIGTDSGPSGRHPACQFDGGGPGTAPYVQHSGAGAERQAVHRASAERASNKGRVVLGFDPRRRAPFPVFALRCVGTG